MDRDKLNMTISDIKNMKSENVVNYKPMIKIISDGLFKSIRSKKDANTFIKDLKNCYPGK